MGRPGFFSQTNTFSFVYRCHHSTLLDRISASGSGKNAPNIRRTAFDRSGPQHYFPSIFDFFLLQIVHGYLRNRHYIFITSITSVFS